MTAASPACWNCRRADGCGLPRACAWPCEEAELAALRDGITIDGIHYGPIEAALERQQGSNVWLTFAIREGKNREVRNVLAHLGLR